VWLKARVVLLVAVALVVIAYAWLHTWSNTGYAPEQPIPFSHKIHAGTNHIPCLYCHTNAERSRHATVPALNVCMNCHSVVAVNKPNIIKLTQAYNSNTPIQWNRVYKLPELAHFDHSRHLAKGFDCAQCHGPVATMDRIYQYRRLNMGDCVNCHRQNNGPQTCETCHQ
jgi:hypothetical protein